MHRTALISAPLLLACLVAPAGAQEDVMTLRAERLAPDLTVLSGFANGNILALCLSLPN